MPSSALIAQYDEGMSNRQVWNNAALMASALLLGDRSGAERIVRAPSGVERHLASGLLADGTWYEGENYHVFAHRGLWYCAVLAETAGIGLDPALKARFEEGFAAPFATALPDYTLPSRKDSQYAVSLRQPRFAELCELGLARGADDATGRRAGRTLLARAAARRHESGPFHGRRRAQRSRHGAHARRPGLAVAAPRPSRRSRRSSPARRGPRTSPARESPVFRREGGEVYVALDWGQSGGGHGHPDRLNLLFMHGDTRWLDDLGTGSYVDASLHWYRSTLAHNAPMINGHSQRRDRTARCSPTTSAAESGGSSPTPTGSDAGVRVTRAVIVTPDYFVDEIRWSADRRVTFDLPMHFDGDPRGLTFDSGDSRSPATALENGFAFVRSSGAADVGAMHAVELAASRGGRTARALRVRGPAVALVPRRGAGATGTRDAELSPRAMRRSERRHPQRVGVVAARRRSAVRRRARRGVARRRAARALPEPSRTGRWS